MNTALQKPHDFAQLADQWIIDTGGATLPRDIVSQSPAISAAVAHFRAQSLDDDLAHATAVTLLQGTTLADDGSLLWRHEGDADGARFDLAEMTEWHADVDHGIDTATGIDSIAAIINHHGQPQRRADRLLLETAIGLLDTTTPGFDELREVIAHCARDDARTPGDIEPPSPLSDAPIKDVIDAHLERNPEPVARNPARMESWMPDIEADEQRRQQAQRERSRNRSNVVPIKPEQTAQASGNNDDEPKRPGTFAIPQSCRDTFIVRMGLDMARVTEMPEATAVMTALGAFSGIASTAFTTGYRDGERLPIGLNIVGEQPPATAKSRLLNSFVTPWLKALRKYNAKAIEAAQEAAEDGAKAKPRTLAYPQSNATPEAIEQGMTEADTGHFWLQSAEQGAIKMLFGDGVKDRPKNFDLALKGFNGEFHASARVTRNKLQREVYGAITVLAQSGSIRTVLANSDGDGLAERFLYVAEPHNLGRRKHEYPAPSSILRERFSTAVDSVMTALGAIPEGERGELDGLKYVGFSSAAHDSIVAHKRRIEPRLEYHANNGDMTMASMLGKADIQAMKIAAVMYLSDCLSTGKPYMATVPDSYLSAAFELVEANLAHVEEILTSMEKMGPEAAREVIRRQFDSKSTRTVREIVQNVKKVRPFKDNAQPSKYARSIVEGMINRGDLLLNSKTKELKLG
nr:DUF3987 domain-containing protein [uncultured Halomonas sp.]